MTFCEMWMDGVDVAPVVWVFFEGLFSRGFKGEPKSKPPILGVR